MGKQETERIIRVLIIEDDVRIATINQRFVEKVKGYQVIGIATDEQQAKEQLEILRPDLVLLDLYFPDMNGFDLLKQIKEQHPDVDVVMITAAREVEAVKQAVRGGVYDFIVKPVIFDRFQETLAQYRQFRLKLDTLIEENEQVTQAEIDELIRAAKTPDGKQKQDYLPTGIDKLTLAKVSAILKNAADGLTTEQVGQEVGASRTTARRYLEYMVSTGDVQADLSYGVVGRPERVYRYGKKGS